MFCSAHGNVLIRKSVFVRNEGRNDYATIVNPRKSGEAVKGISVESGSNNEAEQERVQAFGPMGTIITQMEVAGDSTT